MYEQNERSTHKQQKQTYEQMDSLVANKHPSHNNTPPLTSKAPNSHSPSPVFGLLTLQ